MTVSVPNGWRLATLGEVCQRNTAVRDPSAAGDESFVYVDISSVDNQAKKIVEPRTILGKDAPSRARQVIRANDILVAKTRPNLNAVAQVPPELDQQICSTGFCVLRPIESELDSDFLLSFVRSTSFVNALSDLVKEALYPAVTDAQVLGQGIPLPPLSEQKRIAAMLNEQMATARRARTALVAGQIEGIPKLRTRKIADLWSIGEIASAKKVSLGDVVEIPSALVNPTNRKFRDLPHVNGERIESRTGRLLEVRTAAEDRMTSPKFVFEPGDVLYSKLRPYLRKVSVARFRGLCSADMYPLRVHKDKAIPEYIAAMLLSEEFSGYAELESRRARMPKLNREQLFAWRFPLPDISAQKRFIALQQSVEQLLQKIEVDTYDQLTAIDALPSAYLRRAFAGEL